MGRDGYGCAAANGDQNALIKIPAPAPALELDLLAGQGSRDKNALATRRQNAAAFKREGRHLGDFRGRKGTHTRYFRRCQPGQGDLPPAG